jgi:hypothetical protein
MIFFWVLQVLVGQFGKKSERQRSVSLLPTADELPGSGWFSRRPLSWRIGAFRRNPVARRAWKKGLFAAERGYRQPQPGDAIKFHIFRYASIDDAREAARSMQSREITSQSVSVRNERKVEGRSIEGISEAQFIEREVQAKSGLGKNWTFYGAAGPVVISINASGLGDFWSWEKIYPIVEQLVAKVERSGA